MIKFPIYWGKYCSHVPDTTNQLFKVKDVFPSVFPKASLRGPAAQSQAFVACSESGL